MRRRLLPRKGTCPSHVCSQLGKMIVSCLRSPVGSRSRAPLPRAGGAPPAELPDPSVARTWSCWKESRGGTGMIRGVEQLCSEEKMIGLVLLSLEDKPRVT